MPGRCQCASCPVPLPGLRQRACQWPGAAEPGRPGGGRARAPGCLHCDGHRDGAAAAAAARLTRSDFAPFVVQLGPMRVGVQAGPASGAHRD